MAGTLPNLRAWNRGREYGLALLAVAGATAVCFLMFPFLALTNLVMVYLLATTVVAVRGYRGPAVLTAALSVLAFDFFFVPPRYSFSVSDTQYLFTFLVMFVVAMIICHLALRLRAEAEAARLGEAQAGTMLTLSRLLAANRGAPAILASAAEHLSESFASEVLALLPDGEGKLNGQLPEKELSVAQWVFAQGRPAGRGTQALPAAEALYLPLTGGKGSVGVLRLLPRSGDLTERLPLLQSSAHQIGLALEVDRLQEDAKAAQLEAEKERLRSSLLSSISHDLRTPLAAIIGSASSLLQGGAMPGKARELLEDIQQEAERLARLVHNLLQTTRLESGAVSLRKEPCALEELVGSALERTEALLAGREIAIGLPEDLPLAPLDSVLIEQLLVNLLENAARHTPAGTPVKISARADQSSLTLEVADRGPGLSAEELERVFDKFYHAKTSTGAGLGLAICKAIALAHGGKISAANRPEGGTVFTLRLPLKENHA